MFFSTIFANSDIELKTLRRHRQDRLLRRQPAGYPLNIVYIFQRSTYPLKSSATLVMLENTRSRSLGIK